MIPAMPRRRKGGRALAACSALCLAGGCSQLLKLDGDYSLGPSSSTGGAGGTGHGCPDGEQDNDGNGSCLPACATESCSGNGTCDDGSGTVACTCDSRFSGPACASCAEGYAGADCVGCAPGFQDSDDDGTCLPACGDSTCSGHGVCDDSSGTATCMCRPGFKGSDCGTACSTGMAGASCDFRIIFGLDIPVAVGDWNTVSDVPYDINDAASAAAFDRVAYRLILDDEEVWVEMDPFTANASELGMPMDVIHDVPIAHATVISFSPNQPNVSVPTSGNVEMWSSCYTAGLNGVYDYDDDITPGTDCYGCVQVFVDQQTVLAFNRWSETSLNHDLGIGQAATGNPDWTFAENAANFTARRLEVYIREP